MYTVDGSATCLPEDLYKELHFIPDPALDIDKERYRAFDEVYGQDTNGSHRPSLATAAGAGDSEADKKNKVKFSGTGRAPVHVYMYFLSGPVGLIAWYIARQE